MILKKQIPHIFNSIEVFYDDEEVILKFDNQQDWNSFIEQLKQVLDKNHCHIDYTPNSFYVIVKQIVETNNFV